MWKLLQTALREEAKAAVVRLYWLLMVACTYHASPFNTIASNICGHVLN